MANADHIRRNVQSIPAGYPFARTLVMNLVHEVGQTPDALARYTVLLPTRRACRSLRDCFLDVSEGRPLLLPKMIPLGDADEGELTLLFMGRGGELPDIPAAISPVRRILILARMLRAGAGFTGGNEQAIALAKALASLIDQTHTEGKSLSDLGSLVPEEFAAHWQITLKFLSIVIEKWPEILADEGLIDPSRRRILLLQSLACYWRTYPEAAGPVIAAGSTGSIPATGDLLDAISALPEGRVILPGLDLELDEESWGIIDETHPQYQMKKLLARFGMQCEDVCVLTPPDDVCGTHEGRRFLAREVMRPAFMTARWAGLKESLKLESIVKEDLLRGVRLYTCDTAQEEAGVIAFLLREALEVPGRTASLITPDRVLARRVAAQCLRWGITVDDSAGTSLSERPIGRFLTLILKTVSGSFDPAFLLALLKHPLCRLAQNNPAIEDFELTILRNERVRPRDLREALILKSGEDKGGLGDFLLPIADALLPLMRFCNGEQYNAGDIFAAHMRAAEALSAGENGEGALWSGDDGVAAARVFAEFCSHAGVSGSIGLRDYEHICRFLMDSVTVRPKFGTHARLRILGQLEARMNDADVIILGSLNEGTWPAGAGFDPWMSREMRANFGLPGLERSVGLAAHDFVQAFCAGEVVLTRARKVDGAPTVPARWLQKMEVVLHACGVDSDSLARGPHRSWVRTIDQVDQFKPCERPVPRPSAEFRPNRVSVTRVEAWLRDPYGYYASYALKLRKIPAFKVKVDAAFCGNLIHKAVEMFVKAHPQELPERAGYSLRGFLSKATEEVLHDTEVIRYWMERTGHALDRIADHERQWRQGARFVVAEAQGETAFDIDGKPFFLQGRVDRIDRMSDGGYAIIDYKSGGTYTRNKIESGELPQLSLEALMLRKGGFSKAGIEALESSYLGYWIFRSGNKGCEVVNIEGLDLVAAVSQRAEELFIELVRAFRSEDAAYLCLSDPAHPPAYNDYEHLERIREWMVLEDVETEAGE